MLDTHKKFKNKAFYNDYRIVKDIKDLFSFASVSNNPPYDRRHTEDQLFLKNSIAILGKNSHQGYFLKRGRDIYV